MPQKADGGEWGEPNMPQLLNPDGSDPFEVDLVHKHSYRVGIQDFWINENEIFLKKNTRKIRVCVTCS